MTSDEPYAGRFAPTPSGPLHFGSLVAAVGSWLDARSQGGHWYLRIDDLDPPRVAKGSVDSILSTLEAFGLVWDGAVLFQSERLDAYEQAVSVLESRGQTFACACTRKDLAGTDVYPGTCRDAQGIESRSIRFRMEADEVRWHDKGLGFMQGNPAVDVGDFVLKNAHGLFSYHLANAVDDIHLGITHVVRGADLAPFTSAHLHVQRMLGGADTAYHHLPLALDPEGNKLSKQTQAEPVDSSDSVSVLNAVFKHLGLPSVQGNNASDLLEQAMEQWSDRWLRIKE